MIKATFKGAPVKGQKPTTEEKKCKCGRCTRNDERSDSSMASSDMN
jgi:hypothetical protein